MSAKGRVVEYNVKISLSYLNKVGASPQEVVDSLRESCANYLVSEDEILTITLDESSKQPLLVSANYSPTHPHEAFYIDDMIFALKDHVEEHLNDLGR